MKIFKIILQVACIVLAVVFSTSLVPYLPFWLNRIELWLIIPFCVVPGNLKTGLIVSMVIGWLIDIYAPTRGLFFLLLPLVSLMVHFVVNSWRTHRNWLRESGAVILGISIFHLLVIGYELGHALLLSDDSSLDRLVDSFKQFPQLMLVNILIGYVLVRPIRYIFSIEQKKKFYA